MTDFFIYLSIGSPIPGALIGLRWYPYLSKPLKIICVLLVVSFIFDLTSLLLSFGATNNLWLINLYGLVSGIFILYFYQNVDLRYFRWVPYVIIIFSAGYLINLLFGEGLFRFNSIAMGMLSLLLILLTFSFFFKIYRDEEILFLERSPIFLIAVGILFYYSGSFFSFLLSTDILSDLPNKFYNSWILHNFSNILKNAIFFIALWKGKSTISTTKSSSS